MLPTTREERSVLLRIADYSSGDTSYVAEVLLKIIDYLEAQEREREAADNV